MGIGGISVPSLLLIFLIVLLLFGTKKLRNLGGDLGSAIRGFKSGLKEDQADDSEKTEADAETVADVKADKVEQDK